MGFVPHNTGSDNMAIGIYIHIPFCKSKCYYCDFNSFSGIEHLQKDYCSALKREIKNYCLEKDVVDTVYFGGGTPTYLPADFLADVLNTIKENYILSENCEITTECNPATIDEKGFIILKKAGFNRLSIGLQSCDDKTLKTLGRIHSFKNFEDCFTHARTAGIENISLDLMYGLPDQTTKMWLDTLKKAVSFLPEHISCYSLKIEDSTPFSRMNLNIPDDDTVREMYDIATDFLESHAYSRYEISNFAKNNFESRHNCKYWKCENFVGFGAGAYSCVNNLRYSNTQNVEKYIESINKIGSAVDEKILLTSKDMMSEFCFLGLRMANGISADEFKLRFGRKIADVFGDELNKNIKRKTIIQKNGRYYIPPEWIFVSNEILSDFV